MAEPRNERPHEPITPNQTGRDHVRGWREGDEDADGQAPGREFGAGQGVDDGPDVGAGADKPRD
jgi:hypothetical protein